MAVGWVWAAGPVRAQDIQEKSAARPKLGLALSGGGARGLAHIGVLKVMEEVGFKPDYIVGTSMGAIIGSLYAVGYTAREIEAIVLAQDWNALLQDQVPRNALSLEDKRDQGKYLGSFPIRQGRVALPTGLVSGQNVALMLSRLLLPARGVTDFHRLPIPFECVATDIETGKPVILDRGYLPEAVRASMALPTLYTPVELDGRLLIDGGVVRDLPVSNALALGADTIIAVDVNSRLAKREQLNSLAKILDQTLLIYIQVANQKEAALSRLDIQPDVSDYSLISFDQAQSLIDRGEAAARARQEELQALARTLGRGPEAGVRPSLDTSREMVRVSGIAIDGLRQVPEELVRRKLNLSVPTRLSCRQIEDAVQRVYGSRYFQSVTYRFRPAAQGETLVIRCTEDIKDVFRFGMHYDTELNAMLLLNTTLRNLVGPGTELRLDAYLSKYTGLNASYWGGLGGRLGLGLRADLNFQNGGMAIYNVDEVEAYLDQTHWNGDVFVQGFLSKDVRLGVGVEKEVVLANASLSHSDKETGDVESLNFSAALDINSLDRSFYPHRGWILSAAAKWITDDVSIRPQESYPPFGRLLLTATHVVPLHSSLALTGGVSGGVTLGEAVNPAQWFFVGGMSAFERNKFPFLGMRFIEAAGPNVLIAHAALQFEPWENRYVILRANIGQTSRSINDLIRSEDLLVGCGLTAGVMTVIGPVEATLMSGSRQTGIAGFLNIGYPF